eukprot:414355_1
MIHKTESSLMYIYIIILIFLIIRTSSQLNTTNNTNDTSTPVTTTVSTTKIYSSFIPSNPAMNPTTNPVAVIIVIVIIGLFIVCVFIAMINVLIKIHCKKPPQNFKEPSQVDEINIEEIKMDEINEPQQHKIELTRMETTYTKDQPLQIIRNITINEHNCFVKECEIVRRILNALYYASTQNVTQLTEYCIEYKTILDDYIHIVSQHNSTNDLDEIYHILRDNYQFLECDINQCRFSLRHYRNRNIDEEEKKELDQDDNHQFYSDLMDRIHCYIFHLYDFGTRVRRIDFEADGREEMHTNYIDNEFKNIKNVIQSKLKLLREINGNETFEAMTNKFNINNNDQSTFMDGLYVSIKQNIGSLNKQKQSFFDLLINEEYDSDSLKMDVDLIQNLGCGNSNIGKQCGNVFYEAVKKFIFDNKLFRRTFNIGYRLYYWNHYKHKVNIEKEQKESWNINDHRGYSINQLFVNIKYSNIKYEILNNNIYQLSFNQLQISSMKVSKYIDTNKVRKITASRDDYLDRNEFLCYGIYKGSPITKNHLLAIILYCDWTDLSTKFTETFRKTNSYDSISSIKQKNTEYGNFSKLIREATEIFGKSSDGTSQDNLLCGPFFCGMSFVMVIAQYMIRLYSPTSTSKIMEVAARFGGDEGILMQLNKPLQKLAAFPCSWISNYPEEEEYVFCGGYERIQIESIRIMETSHNFQTFFKSLYVFDKMLNSNFLFGHKLDITHRDCSTLNNLIMDALKLHDVNTRYPKYIQGTFRAFLNNKSQIVINLHHIKNYFQKISSLLFDQNLLFKKILLDLFTNVESIIIQSYEIDIYRKLYEYKFDLSQFLELLDSSNMAVGTIIMIKAARNDNGNSWLSEQLSFKMRMQYENKNLDIKLKTIEKEDRVEISRFIASSTNIVSLITSNMAGEKGDSNDYVD